MQGGNPEGQSWDDGHIDVASSLQLESLQERGQEEKVICPSENLSRTFSFSHSEQDDLLMPDEFAGVPIDEPFRFERFGVGKVSRIHVDSREAGEHL